jgi:hypothetical protein
MTFDLHAATQFMAGHARTLDRRRFELLLGDGDPEALLAAVDGYRNPDGGYGWGLEPDLRSPESQPGGALHAFEAMADAAPATTPHAVALCEWLASATLPDGGLPFALPVTDPAACAPFWANADPAASSLQITAFVAAQAHRVARHDPAVAAHPWLAGATEFCVAAIDALGDEPFALAVTAALQLVDAAGDEHPELAARLDALGRHIPEDGLLRVSGGTEDEMIRPLVIAPRPARPVRSLFDDDLVERELERLAAEQQDDGGWRVDFRSFSPAAELEWRGYETVRAVSILRENDADS